MSSSEIATQMPDVIEVDGDAFTVISVLGKGGMGIVYKAHQKSLDRIVALKMLLSSQYLEQVAIQRLRREAMAAAQLHHPNIVKVHSLGMYKNSPFIVMEYVEGRVLSDILDERGKLPVDEAFEIFVQQLDALTALHDAGFIHRDIKPSNMIVTADGTSKLMDFGIAKQMFTDMDSQRMTQTGAMVGSPAYMSPEQCNAAALDARSDLYSLGCTMYRAFSGKDAFEADTPLEVMYMHIHGQVTTLSSIIDPSLAEVIAQAMAKEPADRFQSASDFKQALLNCRQGGYERTTKRRKRRQLGRAPLLVAFSVLGAVLVSAFAIHFWSDRAPAGTDSGERRWSSSIAYREADKQLTALGNAVARLPPAAKKERCVPLLRFIDQGLDDARYEKNIIAQCCLRDTRARTMAIYDPEQALKEWDKTLQFCDEQCAGKSDEYWETWITRYLHALGTMFMQNNLPLFNDTVERATRVIDQRPKTHSKRPFHLSSLYGQTSDMESQNGDLKAAEKHARLAVAEMTQCADDLNPSLSSAYARLANVLYLQGRHDEVIALIEERLPKTQKVLEAVHEPDMMRERYRLLNLGANEYANQGDKQKSLLLLTECIQTAPGAGYSEDEIADVILAHGDHMVLLKYYDEGYLLVKQALDRGGQSWLHTPRGVTAMLTKASIEQATLHFSTAYDTAAQALQLAQQFGTPQQVYHAKFLLGSADCLMNRHEQAEKWLLEVRNSEGTVGGIEPRLRFNVRRFLANNACRTRDFANARIYYREGNQLLKRFRQLIDPPSIRQYEYDYRSFVKAVGA